MAQEIDLIMNPGSAPETLKVAVDAHKKSYTALLKEQKAFDKSRADLAAAKDVFASTQTTYADELKKWEVK